MRSVAAWAAVVLFFGADFARPGEVASVPRGYAIVKNESGELPSLAWGKGLRHVLFAAARGEEKVLVSDGRIVSRDFERYGFSPWGDPYWIGRSKTGRVLRVGTRAFGPYEAIERIRFSREGRSFGAILRVKGRAVLLLNGRRFGPFDRLGDPVLSVDGRRCFAWAVREGEIVLLENGRPEPEFSFEVKDPADPFVSVGTVVLSEDGKSRAFRFSDADGEWIDHDGKRYGPFDAVRRPVLGKRGRSLLFSRFEGSNRSAVLQWGKKKVDSLPDGRPFDRILSYALSPLGEPDAIVSPKEGSEMLLVGAWSSEAFDRIIMPTFSEDGERFAFVGRRNNRAYVVSREQTGPPFDWIDDVAFHPETGGLYYRASLDDKVFFVGPDGRNGPFEEAGWMRFSKAYARPAFAAKENGRWYVHSKDRKVPVGKGAEVVRDLAWLGKKGRIAMWSWRGPRGWFLSGDGKRRGPFDEIFDFYYDKEAGELVLAVRRGDSFFRITETL